MNNCRIKKIGIENYRNIQNAELEFFEGINIITGENGQGKTNLLETIWLLTGAKSFRGSKDKDLINKNCDFAKIKASIIDDDYQKDIEILIANTDNKKGRFGRINQGEQKRAASLAGKFYCVVFCPQHLTLVSGSPSLKRKFVDGALCQLYPNYIKLYKTFERYLEQKNSLLKNYRNINKKEFEDMIDIYNRHLTEYGYEIYLKRKDYIDNLSKKACEYYKNISADKEKISFNYLFFADSKQKFYDLLSDSKEKDKMAGFSTSGVQREDIEILIDGEDAKTFASQGQQRSIVLAMKLSESDILKDVCDREPVILLDDVLSELDYSRQEYLLNHIKEKQVFISSCDENRIKLVNSKKYFVKNGAIEQCI